jgi:uncharacterized protein with GYD domain
MKTFVLMTKLAPSDGSLMEVSTKLKSRAKSGRAWIDEIKRKCPGINFTAHYALMGYWDFMDIYQAPDERTAAKVSLLTRSYISAEVESWCAIPYEEIVDLTEELEDQQSETLVD